MDMVRSVCDALAPTPNSANMEGPETLAIAEICNAILKTPSSQSIVARIRNTWPVMVAQVRKAELGVLISHLRTQTLMLANWTLWNWLESKCVEPGRLWLLGHRDPAYPSWIQKLLKDIKVYHNERTHGYILAAEDYIEGFPEGLNYTLRPRNNQRIPLSELENQNEIIRTLRKILIEWLGFPTKNGLEAKAKFVSILCTTTGNVHVLLLQETWLLCKALPKHLSNTRRYPGIQWTRLSNALMAHPLANPRSQESILLNQIGAAYDELARRAAQAKGNTEGLQTAIMPDHLQQQRMASFLQFLRYDL
jgi:hypothetical protein